MPALLLQCVRKEVVELGEEPEGRMFQGRNEGRLQLVSAQRRGKAEKLFKHIGEVGSS